MLLLVQLMMVRRSSQQDLSPQQPRLSGGSALTTLTTAGYADPSGVWFHLCVTFDDFDDSCLTLVTGPFMEFTHLLHTLLYSWNA